MTGVRGDLAVKLFGTDQDQLNRTAEAIVRVLESIPGAQDVYTPRNEGAQYLNLEVDRLAAGRLGVDVDALAALLRALVEHYADRPHVIPDATARAALPAAAPIELIEAGSTEAVRAAVAYVAGMTDRFACERGIVELNWDPARLPTAVA